jgi:C-terminal processing protease CtpA/Prc
MHNDLPLDRRTLLAGGGAALALIACDPVRAAESSGIFREDAAVLERIYTALHPGLYRYNTPAEMAARFAALQAYLSQPRTQSEAYIALARLTAAVRCGHSYPNFYNQRRAVVASLFENRTCLPFHFRWLGDRMIVTRDLSPARMPPGTEIRTIEAMPAKRLLAMLMPLARADGHNDAKRRRILEVEGLDAYQAFDIYLPLLLPMLVRRGAVMLDVRRPDGHHARVEVALMTARERAALAPSPIDRPKDAILWSVTRRANGIAILDMPSWSVYNGSWDWAAWLNARLDEIATDGTQTLIVDLRGNEGGLDCGDPILARLIDRDLVTAAVARRVRARKVPDTIRPYVDTWDPGFYDWGSEAVGPDAQGFLKLLRWSADTDGRSIIRPAGKRFHGRLIVLVDAVNSSATFQFAQIVRDNRLGILVGETTGGNRRGINGGAFLFIRLPASGLEVDVPLIGYFPPTPQPDAGIAPDIAVEDAITDIATGTDRAMRTAIASAA